MSKTVKMKQIDEMQIYVVKSVTGQYEDKTFHVERAFTTVESAKAYARAMNSDLKKYEDAYSLCDDYEKKRDGVYREYLRSVDAGLLDRCERLFGGEEPTDGILTDEQEADINRYEEMFAVLMRNCESDEFTKAAVSYGLSDAEIEELRNAVTYEEKSYEIPYYYVQHEPVTLKLF